MKKNHKQKYMLDEEHEERDLRIKKDISPKRQKTAIRVHHGIHGLKHHKGDK